MKRILIVVLAFLLMMAPLSGCTQKEITKTGSAQGYGGTVTVAVTVKGHKITEVAAKADNETPGVGGKAIETMPEAMVKANSVDVDGVAGATYTSAAVLSAAKQAYDEALGKKVATADVKMEPGTYTGKGSGFAMAYQMVAKVTVDKDKIQLIELTEEDAETRPIRQTVIDKMIPRIIESQSTAVDTITGATGTSNGLREAVNDALSQALAKGGSDVAALASFEVVPEKIPKETQKIETGVLVVGMGGTGSAAAMRAAEIMYAKDPKNVKVFAIDKAGKYGGTSAVTSEMMAINPPKFQDENNTGKDYVDKTAMRKAWLEYTEGDAKTEMIDLMLNNSGNVVDWLMGHGFKFNTPKRGFTPSDVYEVKYQYYPTLNGFKNDTTINAQYFDNFYKDYESLGGKYLLEIEAYSLIFDQDSKTVKGVKAKDYTGTEYEIYADSVILATGGFAGNGKMETEYLSNEYYPLQGEWKQDGMHQNDGKMIQNAIDLGAGTYNIGMPPMVHLSSTPSFLTGFKINTLEGKIGVHEKTSVWSVADMPANMVVAPNSLAVNPKGKRFTSETGVAMLDPWKAGPIFYSIWSEKQVQELKTKGFTVETGPAPGLDFLGYQSTIPRNTPLPEAHDVLNAGIAAGFIVKADTIADLAKGLGINQKTLTNTVTTYNDYCKTGVDKEFGKPKELLQTIGDGPYYAVTGASYCYSTCGGLDVNKNFNVLMSDGKTPIHGLYAAGTDAMGVLFSEKKPYVTFGGAAMGWAFTSGYLSGEIAANSALNQ